MSTDRVPRKRLRRASPMTGPLGVQFAFCDKDCGSLVWQGSEPGYELAMGDRSAWCDAGALRCRRLKQTNATAGGQEV